MPGEHGSLPHLELRHFLHFSSDLFRAGQHAINGDSGAGDRLGKAAREGNLRSLGYAVMNHFDGDLQRTLTRNEDNAAPIGALHGRQTEAGKAHALMESSAHIGKIMLEVAA